MKLNGSAEQLNMPQLSLSSSSAVAVAAAVVVVVAAKQLNVPQFSLSPARCHWFSLSCFVTSAPVGAVVLVVVVVAGETLSLSS